MGIFGWNRDSNSQPEDNNMTALLPVFGCNNSNRKADIVFVHGLAGHSWGTWHPQSNKDGKNIDFWLYWLGEDLQAEGIDVGVWTFGYEAARFEFSGAAMSRFDLGSNLLQWLEVKNIGGRPLIFVTHSMGGLVVKEAIRTAQDFDDKKAIINLTKGIVFLSTPHTGSHLANLIENFRVFTRPNVNVEELRAHTPELRRLNQWYRQNVNGLTIRTQVFYETRKISGILVVDEDSANPGIRDVQPIAIAEDHNSIAKPQKNDLVYESVKLFVRKELSTDLESKTLPTDLTSETTTRREFYQKRFYRWDIRSTTKAQDGLYEYDALLRLHDVQTQKVGQSSPVEETETGEDEEEKNLNRNPANPKHYRKFGALGKGFRLTSCPAVVLIDEIDKADLDFPNDLLTVLDEPWKFTIKETGETIQATYPRKDSNYKEDIIDCRPIVIITSNKEKGNLPAPFLRRCLYHYVEFPSDEQLLQQIVEAHYKINNQTPPPDNLIKIAIKRFLKVWDGGGLFKKPGTSEFLDWLVALHTFEAEPYNASKLENDELLPYRELLFKLQQDWRKYSKVA